MGGHNTPIDLTAAEERPSSPSNWKRKRRCCHTADTIDLSSPASTATDAVDLGRSKQADEAGPSNYEQPANIAEVHVQHAAAEPEEEGVSTSKGKRKRSWAADRARQAETKKKVLEAEKAAAKALRDEAKAAKKATEQKRVDQFGKTVRCSTKPSEKTKERMARAMPSKCPCMYRSVLKSQLTYNAVLCHSAEICLGFYADSGHRLFLLDRHMASPVTGEDGPAEQFRVLGATANGKPFTTKVAIKLSSPFPVVHLPYTSACHDIEGFPLQCMKSQLGSIPIVAAQTFRRAIFASTTFL